jgi:hypothetical protein
LAEAKDFSLLQSVQTGWLWGPPSLLFNGYKGSFQEVKQTEYEVDHLPLPSVKVKNEWHYTSTSRDAFMACPQLENIHVTGRVVYTSNNLN